ncbi:MAG: tol-pal system protein YbgF [Nitratireductor sp.]|nr:tol-pal system protein YbgF [Nitratireductor sp.]
MAKTLYQNFRLVVLAGTAMLAVSGGALAQSSDAAFRINQLEEQVRVLNGQVEEMTFQLLQMQEQLRKMQEDNEFRFQELENRGDAGGSGNKAIASQENNSLGKSQPSDLSAPESSDGTASRKSLTDLIEQGGGSGDLNLGEPANPLGSLTFDQNGNLVDSNVGKPIDLTGQLNAGQNQLASLPESAAERFNLGYQYVQAGDYEQAEAVFGSFVADFPTDPRLPDASFWLGESLFSQGRYEEAARVFLSNHKQFPDAPLAAQNLLKLGVSLAGLDQRELACATYAEVPKKYPGMSNAIRKRVEIEQQAAKCKNS